MSASRNNPKRFTERELKRSPYTWFQGDCLDFLDLLPDNSIQLVLTSPPYAIKKEYEGSTSLAEMIVFQEELIEECFRVLKPGGSICWQVGNHIEGGGEERVPWDILLYKIFKRLGLKLRNRIVWHYEHGMHARHFFSGRYEVVMWFTKGDEYHFDLDAVRIPQKQPTKRFYKGPKKGELSCNPLGKNPGDVWKITNIKNNHPEKIPGGHPCQFPLQLVERLVKSLTKPGDIVLDPFGGVASTLVGSILLGRIGLSSELDRTYYKLGAQRIRDTMTKTKKLKNLPKTLFVPTRIREIDL